MLFSTCNLFHSWQKTNTKIHSDFNIIDWLIENIIRCLLKIQKYTRTCYEYQAKWSAASNSNICITNMNIKWHNSIETVIFYSFKNKVQLIDLEIKKYERRFSKFYCLAKRYGYLIILCKWLLIFSFQLFYRHGFS